MGNEDGIRLETQSRNMSPDFICPIWAAPQPDWVSWTTQKSSKFSCLPCTDNIFFVVQTGIWPYTAHHGWLKFPLHPVLPKVWDYILSHVIVQVQRMADSRTATTILTKTTKKSASLISWLCTWQCLAMSFQLRRSKYSPNGILPSVMQRGTTESFCSETLQWI